MQENNEQQINGIDASASVQAASPEDSLAEAGWLFGTIGFACLLVITLALLAS